MPKCGRRVSKAQCDYLPCNVVFVFVILFMDCACHGAAEDKCTCVWICEENSDKHFDVLSSCYMYISQAWLVCVILLDIASFVDGCTSF